MLAAACASPGGNPRSWTSDIKPPAAQLELMARVCGRCPVLSECAAHALDTGAESGMYAGVWVPARRYGGDAQRLARTDREQARRQLSAKARSSP